MIMRTEFWILIITSDVTCLLTEQRLIYLRKIDTCVISLDISIFIVTTVTKEQSLVSRFLGCKKMLRYMIDNSLKWVYKASDLTVSAQLQRRKSTADQRWVFSLFSSLLVSNTKTLQWHQESLGVGPKTNLWSSATDYAAFFNHFLTNTNLRAESR